MQEIKISPNFFKTLEDKCDLMSLIEGKITNVITIKNKIYCLSGAKGTGTGIGWAEMYAYELTPVSLYKGEKKPLLYVSHFKEVDKGKRARSYDGLLAKHKGTQYVLTGKQIVIKKDDTAIAKEQGSLF